MQTHEAVDRTTRARSPFGPAHWLWCLHCGRFFQGRDARPDAVGGREGCAFTDCDGAGYGVDVFDWNAWASDDPSVAARWPALDQLYVGRVARPWCEGDDDDDDDDPCEDLGDGSAWIEPVIARQIAARATPTVSHFRDLPLERLERILRAGTLAVCAARCADGPGVAAVLEFMRAWPEARAHGHTVSRDDDGDGVAIEGVECDLTTVAPARWEAIREAFHAAFGGASEYFNEPDWLYAWWD